jgi:hypothetical protein
MLRSFWREEGEQLLQEDDGRGVFGSLLGLGLGLGLGERDGRLRRKEECEILFDGSKKKDGV